MDKITIGIASVQLVQLTIVNKISYMYLINCIIVSNELRTDAVDFCTVYNILLYCVGLNNDNLPNLLTRKDQNNAHTHI